jgi:hypothetical protein
LIGAKKSHRQLHRGAKRAPHLLMLCGLLFPLVNPAFGNPTFEEGSCAWALHHIPLFPSISGEEGFERHSNWSALDALVQLNRLEAFARQSDALAQYQLGHCAWDSKEPATLKWRDFPGISSIDCLNQNASGFRTLPKAFREALVKEYSSPESDAFPWVNSLLVSQRIVDLRAEHENASAQSGPLLKGTPVPAIYLIGLMLPLAQKAFIDTKRVSLPIPKVVLVDVDFPLRVRAHAQLGTLIRTLVEPELHAEAFEERVHFNTDKLIYSGMCDTQANGDEVCWDADRIAYAVDSALSFEGRSVVTIEVPLEGLYNYNEAVMLRGGDPETSSLTTSFAKMSTVTRSRQFASGTIFKKRFNHQSMLRVALGLTAEIDALTDSIKTVHPGDGSLDYRFVFRKRNGKRVEIQFIDNSYDSFGKALRPL